MTGAADYLRIYQEVLSAFDNSGVPGWETVTLWLAECAWESLADEADPAVRADLAPAIDLSRGTAAIRCYNTNRERGDLLAYAVEVLADLVTRLPDGDSVKPKALTNLCSALHNRHHSPWVQPEDLDDAADAGRRAIDLTEPRDPWYASRVNNHGGVLRDRYERSGRIADLTEAVESQQRLLDAGMVPEAHRAMVQNNLAQGLREIYEVRRDRSYLRRAARTHLNAVRSARELSPSVLPRALSNAGITLRMWRPNEAGILEAIALQREGVELTGSADVDRPARTGSLANSWLDLSRRQRRANALDSVTTASTLFDEALERIGEDSPRRTPWLLGRAEAWRRRWELTGADEHREISIVAYAECLDEALARAPITAPDAARGLGLLAVSSGDLDGAVTAFRRGRDALDAMLPEQLARHDQRTWQRHGEGLAAALCVGYVRRGRSEEAALAFDSFRARDSALAASIVRIADSTAVAPSPAVREARRALFAWYQKGGPASNIPIDQIIHDQLGAAAARDIRALTAPAGAAELVRAGRHVVYLVCSDVGGAVVVADPDGPVTTRYLRRLTLSKVQKQRRVLRAAYRDRHRGPAGLEEALRRFGAWIAYHAIIPLLEMVSPSAPLTIVAGGPLAELPLLAAQTPDASDFLLLGRPIVFAGTARSLAAAAPLPAAPRAVAVVSDINPVNGLAETEAQALGLLGPVRVLDAGVHQPQAIAHQLGGYHLIHMACHGAASRTDATESMVYLGGGKVLTVADILRAPLREKPLVFLASCETAAPDPMLPDQTFGPPTAFLHAGAGAVVAPVFTVQLSAARLLSSRFYDELTLAVTPDQALAAAQRWMATTATAEKVQYLRGLVERLDDADCPSNALRRFTRTLERLDPDTAAPSWWCPFQLNA